MNELSDRRLAWQPDIYQRYSFLARLTDILSGEGSGPLTLLDVGSGPVALTGAFVSPRFDVVRADVSQFDDPSIVLLHPGEPLPFEDAAFDVAVALEVLEHVPPAERPSLIRELQRVSRQATIVCCPIDTPEIVEAERQFSAYAKAVAGRDVDFLVEHREHGLPAAADIVSWFSEPGSALVAENAPLDEWLAFNVLDFIYACDLGDHEAKGRFAAAVNARAPLARSGAAHYRRFFCAFTSPAHAATAARIIDAAKSSDATESQRLVGELVTGILGWRQELRERSTREVEASTGTSVSWIRRSCASRRLSPKKMRTSGSSTTLSFEFKDAIGEKDAHSQKLDLLLVETIQSLQEAQGALAQKDARLLEVEANANVTAETMASARADASAQVEQLEEALRQADALRDEDAAARSALSAEHAELEESTRRSAALERELQAILTSRWWRLTAPMRRITGALRRRPFITAPVGALAGMRRWVRERTTRRRNYALAAESGLFDATWYRERYPDVGSHVDPLVHYLKRSGIETRDPHPLFSSSFYLESHPDVAAAGVNPLAHYLERGAREGRDPHPLFSSSFYLKSHPDVAAAGVNPLAHYLERGAREGRDPHPLFSSSFYLKSHPDVAAAGVNPLAHYLERGAREGRDPHPLFSSSFYLESHPDVAAAGVNPLAHYLERGAREGRDPHPLFSTRPSIWRAILTSRPPA